MRTEVEHLELRHLADGSISPDPPALKCIALKRLGRLIG